MEDRVTAVVSVRGGYHVRINEGDAFFVSHATFRALPLAVGEPVDEAAYRDQLTLEQYPEALQRAVSLLAARARSRVEVERRLEALGYQADAIALVVRKLEREALLDDAAFARAWAEARLSRKLGKARIMQELRVKGVSTEIASEAVQALDADTQDAQAVALAQKLLQRHPLPLAPEARRKLLGAMLRRGFAYSEANRALECALTLAQEDRDL